MRALMRLITWRLSGYKLHKTGSQNLCKLTHRMKIFAQNNVTSSEYLSKTAPERNIFVPTVVFTVTTAE